MEADILTRYKSLDYPLPETNLAWRMREAGVENFGKTGAPDELALPEPADDEVLVRVDAIGICFSDVKLITQGSGHPRITGRDLAADPVTAGHEVSLTVVRSGAKWQDQYKPGSRYIVQADVYYRGASLAYGYVLPGGMQQYGIVGEPVLNGDEGSYLIPVEADISYAEAALVEPWTCVVAAYRIYPRRALKSGGVTLVVGAADGSYTLGDTLCADGAPSKLILAGIGGGVKIDMFECTGTEIVEIDALSADAVKPLSQERTGGSGFDDVIVLGAPTVELAEELGANLARNAVMAVVADTPISGPARLDVGRVHYDYIDYVGTSSGNAAEAYAKSRDSEFIAGGTAWFIGAAGPMGQMHVQRAVRMADGPSKILCTDVDDERLDYLKATVDGPAAARGIEIVYLNPITAGEEGLENAIRTMTDGDGFDDIVVLAPVTALIEGAIPHLAEGGLMNIFAGVPRGTIAKIDLSVAYMKGNRFVGSSGSRPQDMVDTLRMTESGELPTLHSMAAVGGIDAMAEGLRGVKEAHFPGKTVIFPHVRLPLTALTELKDAAPEVYAKLEDGKFWTDEAEQELLKAGLEI